MRSDRFAYLILAGLLTPGLNLAQQRPSSPELVEQFKTTKVFWQQIEIAKKLVELRDLSVLPPLKPWLADNDRHLRGNAAFVFAGLGDGSGFDIIAAMLGDRSDRSEGQGTVGGRWSLQQQIDADRYYAVHLFGELKERNTIPLLAPLLDDPQVNYKVAWALGEIGGDSAVEFLMNALQDKNSDVRVIAIESLAKLNAKEALPKLRALLEDNEKSHIGGQVSVAEAARAAITRLGQTP